jgi:prepilin-type N-terminal cleavage/methylation domain-containing protein
MSKYGISSPAGFTIVETMFVLAIAGVIMLVVFLSFPVLERASHNSDRKEDIVTILQYLSRYELNNSGAFPACSTTAPNEDCGDTDATDTNAFLQNSESHLVFYTTSEVSAIPGSPSGPSISAPSGDDNVDIYNYYKCDGNSAVSTGAGYRDVVALYNLQSGGGGYTVQCQQL